MSELLVGIDVGGTKIQTVAVDRASGSIVAKDRRPTPQSATEFVDALVAGFEAVAHQARAKSAGSGVPVAVGLGIPGFVDRDGITRKAPHLGGVVDLDLVSMLSSRIGTHVRVDNDANCAAWAAFIRDAPDAESIIAITIGTGIGGGVVIDGTLLRGAHGFAGEPGHMIVDPSGPLCSCGQHGCWEVWASGNGLTRLVSAAAAAGELPHLVASMSGVHPDGRAAMAGLSSDDPSIRSECQLVLDRFSGWISIGVVNLINLIDPGCIVFSGGIVEEGDVLLAAIRSAVASHATMSAGRTPDIRISSVGPLAGAIGAALLAGEGIAGR